MYKYFSALMLPLLRSPPLRPKKTDKPEDTQKLRDHNDFIHCLADFSVELDKTYFAKLCEELQQAIHSQQEARVVVLTGAMLSDLIYQGYSHSSLYGWHKKFLTIPSDYSFSQNLQFMLRILRGQRPQFRVTLQLSGTDKLSDIGTQGRFTFSQRPTAPADADERTRRFFRPYHLRTFATCEIQSTDHEAAAFQARWEVESLLDVMRLEFQRNPVTIESEVHACRIDDNRAYLVRVKSVLPNPVVEMTHEDFAQFAERVEGVLCNHDIEGDTKEQLRASIRQYRIGRDSLRPQDKCLHWWMGLEALAYSGNGNVGDIVVHNVARVLVCGYLHRLLQDMVSTLKHCRINWSEDLEKSSGCETLDSLSEAHLLRVLEDGQIRPILWRECVAHPIIEYHWERLGTALESPTTTGDLLRRHLDHVEWQVCRLYRIRCCIVHGSEVKHTLYPFAANLEYYLKQLILFVINILSSHQHIRSRKELFLRASLSFDRKIAFLNNTSDPDAVTRAVFEDIVLHDSLA
ncbi:MAG: hypothetical protein ACHRXM_13515 [Isosphaerales bacterium]